jgi:Domain of unknown function (DUF5667)
MMWPPFGRRAAQFAARIDGRQVSGSLDDDTAALVSLAQRLRQVEPPVMSADFSTDLRVRLLEAAPRLLVAPEALDSEHTQPVPRRRSTRQLRVGLASATAIVVATCVGIGYASQGALPGDPLYPFKQTIEHIQVATAGSLFDKGKEQLDQASTRLSEVEGLADDGSPGTVTSRLISSALGDFSSQASTGTQTLLQAYRVDGEEQAIVAIHDFTKSSVATLEGLSTQVPAKVLADVGSAASDMQQDDHVALATCTHCTQQEPLVLPPKLETLARSTSDDKSPTAPVTSTVPSVGASTSAEVPPSADSSTSTLPSSSPPSVVVPPPSGLAPPSTDTAPPDLTAGTVTAPPITESAPPSLPTQSAGPTSAPPPESSEPPPTSVSVPTDTSVPVDPTESAPVESSAAPTGLTSAPTSEPPTTPSP